MQYIELNAHSTRGLTGRGAPLKRRARSTEIFRGPGLKSKERISVMTIKKFFANESGATAIEYGLLASLIAVAIIAGMSALSGRINGEFNEISGALK